MFIYRIAYVFTYIVEIRKIIVIMSVEDASMKGLINRMDDNILNIIILPIVNCQIETLMPFVLGYDVSFDE